MWIGGGAGMAPLRAQIMHLTKTLHVTDRKMSYFYGARAVSYTHLIVRSVWANVKLMGRTANHIPIIYLFIFFLGI